jgi:hypothetical protein
LANIYLVSFAPGENPAGSAPGLSVPESSASPLLPEIRVGYFTLCARVNDGDGWSCGDRVDVALLGVSDPWNIHQTASDYRSNVVSPTLK